MKKKYFNFGYVFLLFFALNLNAQQQEIYIALDGSDSNTGECDQPMASLQAAVNKSRATGAKTIWIKGGRYFFNETVKLGGQDQGLFISGYEDEKVIFDGGEKISTDGFNVVSNNLGGRIKNGVVGKIAVSKIEDLDVINLLKSSKALLTFNDKAASISRFPNVGFGVFRKETVLNGNEQANQEGTHQNPKGPVFKLFSPHSSYNRNAWENEIKRHKKIEVTGYTSAGWLRETNLLATAKFNGDYIRLVDGTRYGIETKDVNRRKRVFFSNVLFELDRPGEWFFDEIDNELYIYPFSTIDQNTRITLASGPQLLLVENAKDLTIEKLAIQNIGKGGKANAAINVKGASDNINIAGVKFQNITDVLCINFLHDVKNSSIKSCDFVDVTSLRFYGGSYGKNFVDYGNNLLENCHFTQVYRAEPYKAAAINGAGNTFRNNLIHNSPIQPFTFYGVEHTIERNEIFNVGTEESDGGAMYGGNGLFTFDNTFKHNFFHHIMSLVGANLGRGGIHYDDFDAGDFTLENVFYRGGSEAVKMGGGGQHKIMRNIIMRSSYGIKNGTGRNVDTNPKFTDDYKKMMDFMNNDPLNGIKANYIGRALKITGIDGWQNGLNENNWINRFDPWWLNKYPRFETLMKAYFNNKKQLAYGCEFKNNFFFDNENDFRLNTGNIAPQVSGNRQINLDMFTDVSSLNFSYNGSQPSYMPNIPFNSIGLYKDEYRCAVPNKSVYRKAVKDFFANRAMDGVPFDAATVNSLTYVNTGLIALSTVPCSDVILSEPLESYSIDLGTANSPVFPDYVRLTNTTNELEYGWLNPNSLKSVDRGSAPGVNALNRDFVFSNEPNTFEAALKNGKWRVLLTFGDRESKHDKMQVKAEGKIVLSDIDSEPSVFFNRTFNVNVTDGRLTLEFSDQGGVNPDWGVTRIVLTETDEEVDCPVNCLGNIYDDDGDGVCNINDICPNGDDNIDTNNNGIPDQCDDIILSTESPLENNKIAVYPNPVNGLLNIDISNIISKKLSLSIVDISGRLIYKNDEEFKEREAGIFSKTLNMSNFTSGIYFVTIQDGNNTNEVVKIIVN